VTTLPTEDEDEVDYERVTSRPGLLGGERRSASSIVCFQSVSASYIVR
jgi:hypothetical protein